MSDRHDVGRDRVLAVLGELVAELSEGSDWENGTLERYLEGLGALLGSIDNHYANMGRPVPGDPWQIVAEALRGARYYE